METTVICQVTITRIIDGECGKCYPEQVFTKQIVDTIKDEISPDDVCVDSVKVFVRE